MPAARATENAASSPSAAKAEPNPAITVAPRAISAGAQSVEDTATQRLLAVATQQISPSFLRQNSIAFRHS